MKIIRNIFLFSKIDNDSKTYNQLRYKYTIEKLKKLKIKILSYLSSILYVLPTKDSKKININQLENKLNYCKNLFDNYSDEIISNKIKINNYNIEKNINNTSNFFEETNLPCPFNEDFS